MSSSEISDDTHICLRCQKTIEGLESYIAHRQSGCHVVGQPEVPKAHEEIEMSADDFFSSLQLQHLCTPQCDHKAEKDKPKDGPASKDRIKDMEEEATFMESIGLCLNRPKPSDSPKVIRSAPMMSPRGNRDLMWEDEILQEMVKWSDQDIIQSSHEVFLEPEEPKSSKYKPPKLISFMKTSKGKVLRDTPETVEDIPRQPLTSLLSPTHTPEAATTKWKLWNPVGNEDLWSDVLDDELYLETAATDPTLMESTAKSSGGGKWLPGMSGGRKPQPFACEICDRVLASKEVYEKHMLSELHFKRSSQLGFNDYGRPQRAKKRPSKFVEESSPKKSEPAIKKKKLVGEKVEAPIRLKIVRCKSCLSQVNKSQYGKHLISHYHHHRSAGHKDNNEIVLSNIHSIVKEAPFQCSICSYYFNWHKEFISHWKTDHSKESDDGSVFWCSLCHYYTRSSDRLLSHLQSDSHEEIVSVINRSVPIRIKRLELEECSECGKAFRLRISLKKHMIAVHGDTSFVLPNQEVLTCQMCAYSTYSARSLRSHIFLAHPENRQKYGCTICHLQFKTKLGAQKHRMTEIHKTKSLEKQNCGSFYMKCDICDKEMSSSAALKTHRLDAHPERSNQCPMCGDRFAAAQDLGVHVRSQCRSKPGRKIRGALECGETGCAFTCDFLNVYLFHQSLAHADKAAGGKHPCTVCEKEFTKSNLWEHVKIHGDNKPRCHDCYRLFTSSAALEEHRTNFHAETVHFPCNVCPYSSKKERLLLLHQKRVHSSVHDLRCKTCGVTRLNEHELREHRRQSHGKEYRCTHEGCEVVVGTLSHLKSHLVSHQDSADLKCTECNFSCKRTSELNRHIRTRHAKEQRIPCSRCSYSATTNQHLERHMSQKHGQNPVSYQCRLCPFLCNNLENLRKHILKTAKHPGESVYKCWFCDFATNARSDFSKHVKSEHENSFQDQKDVDDSVKNYFVVDLMSKADGSKRTRKQTLNELVDCDQ